MEKEKGFGFDAAPAKDDFASDNTSRARNKTVMLTPEMTNQVRNRFQQDAVESSPQPTVSGGAQSHGGFETPRSSMSATASSGYVSAHSGYRSVSEPPPAAVPRQSHPPVAQATAPDGDAVVWVRETPVVGFLVSYDSSPNGSVFELRVGRLIVSNQLSTDNVLYLTDSTVSSSHAIIRVSQSGEIQVLDQLSEHGTSIKRFGSADVVRLSGDKASVEHGDTLSFGDRNFHVCTVPREG